MFQLKNFNIHFGEVNVINKVNVNIIVENEVNVIFGQNGVGKTAFLEAISLVSDNYDGDITYLDQNYSELSSNQKLDLINSEFAYLPQKLNLIDGLNAIDNLKLVANQKHQDEYFINILEKVNISSEYYSQKVKKLSLGMKQRIAIARTLVNNPRVIFFDEPSASLDFKNIDNFIKIIGELVSKNITVVIITHDDIFLEKYKYIIEVENTKVIPTYIINNETSQVEFIKNRKKNIKLINKTSRVFRYLFFLLILIGTLIASAFLVLGLNGFFAEVYNASVRIVPDDAIVLQYDPYVDSGEDARYYTNEELNSLSQLEVVAEVYPIIPENSIKNVYANVIYEYKNYQVSVDTDMILLPENEFVEYNYLGLYLVSGTYPKDNSHEILISEDILSMLGIKDASSAIGTEIEVTSEKFGTTTTAVISGVYKDGYNSTDKIYIAYNKELITKIFNTLYTTDHAFTLESFAQTYNLLYVTLEPESNKELVTDEIVTSSKYLYPFNYDYDKYEYAVFLIFILLIYSFAILIIFSLIKLKNNPTNKILKTLGYKQSSININNIKQNNKFMIISLLIMCGCYIVTTSILDVFFLPILIITVIVIYLISLICNLLISIFVK